jgi:hypothetical protein
VVLASALVSAPARAQQCMTLSYTFQPDCYRPDPSSACVQTVARLDPGPQIAVWVQSADGTQFVDTLMVTNLTAVRGIGNRPGRWDFLSGPWFPYGKRQMALPIWAHARGVLYDTVVMEEAVCEVGGAGYPGESCLGWHEPYSSPDPYFCRPLMLDSTTSVDAITCPSRFNSEKGKLDPTTKSYYPPRGDLTAFTSLDSPDPPTYAAINDLDAVAAATPAYGSSYGGSWTVPSDLTAGDYAVLVEVNKEFDANDSHMHPDFDDLNLPRYGTDGNFGQPSVLYRVPIHIDLASGVEAQAAVSEIAGYGDWSGATGTINPPDDTISTTNPGSGAARLLQTDGSGGSGRVHVALARCLSCTPLPPAPSAVTNLAPVEGGLTATAASFSFSNAQANGGPVWSYQIRYMAGTSMTDVDFAQAISAQQVVPGSPGSPSSFSIPSLRPTTTYVVGVRAVDGCGQTSAIVEMTFQTPSVQFTQLSGCFVATAAWGSALGPEVTALRRVRDRLRPAGVLFAAATDIYYRSGPAAAEVLRRSDTARALVRRFLGPVGSAAEAFTQPGLAAAAGDLSRGRR